ncbi:unnamed protein product, partial [marine sediment metagenome]
MPYPSLASLPDAVKALPKHGQEIYQKAFNAAFEQYDDEGKAAATAWAAVNISYKKSGDKWVAKEAIMPTKISDKERAGTLQTALIAQYGLQVETPIPGKVAVEEVYESDMVYSVDGQFYRSSYEIDEAGKAIFGEPEKVVGSTVFTPIESLQAKYAEVIQEAAKR